MNDAKSMFDSASADRFDPVALGTRDTTSLVKAQVDQLLDADEPSNSAIDPLIPK